MPRKLQQSGLVTATFPRLLVVVVVFVVVVVVVAVVVVIVVVIVVAIVDVIVDMLRNCSRVAGWVGNCDTPETCCQISLKARCCL